MYQLVDETSIRHLPTGTVFPWPPVESFGHDCKAWIDAGNVPEPAPQAPAPTTNEVRAEIDSKAGRITRDVVGDLAEEYRQAEGEARAWVAAGYSGETPATVSSWAVVSGQTDVQACDGIIAQADAWRDALAQIRASRMACKALAATDPAAALTQWGTAEAAFRAALGIN